MRKPRVVSVGVYERVVRASLERVWENVLDWEHLPGLHRASFSAIRRIDAGDWGWTAEVRTPGAARPVTIQVVLERENLRYVSATIDGPGKGTEIWTQLAPRGEHETALRVEFLVPDPSPERVATLGAGYRALYARLWDEDESMMRRRAKWLAERARAGPSERASAGKRAQRGAAERTSVELGRLEDLRPKLPLGVELGGRPWRVAEVDGALVAFSAICPHALGPLEDVPVEAGVVECPWHRYRFDVRSGRSCDGRGLHLAPPPRVEIGPDGSVSLVLE
jgi:nitrite reductase/ring-hydroxylating ferredoxin subunit